jgi:hypothetical protein
MAEAGKRHLGHRREPRREATRSSLGNGLSLCSCAARASQCDGEIDHPIAALRANEARGPKPHRLVVAVFADAVHITQNRS